MKALDHICRSMEEAAREAGNYLRETQKKVRTLEIETKSANSFVTEADRTAEIMIIQHLRKQVPEAGFIAEEGTEDHRGERFNWIIDPLDGTTNFLHGLPSFCVSLALTDHQEVIAGVIYEPHLDECFYAWQGSPAYLNGNVIRVSPTLMLADSLLATGFPYYDFGKTDDYLAVMKYFMEHTRGLRRWGSAAIDLAYVACGRFDAFYEYGLQPWDVAAGALIVQQAGGRVSTFGGTGNYIFGKEILASNGHLHGELLKAIRDRFPIA